MRDGHVHDKQYNHDRKCVYMYMSMRDGHVHDKQHNKIHDRKCVYMYMSMRDDMYMTNSTIKYMIGIVSTCTCQ